MPDEALDEWISDLNKHKSNPNNTLWDVSIILEDNSEAALPIRIEAPNEVAAKKKASGTLGYSTSRISVTAAD